MTTGVAVTVANDPAQTAGLFTNTVGFAFIITVPIPEFTQPFNS